MALEADTLGKVTRVLDGDTIEVDGKKQHIRIAETDAPEYVQRGGDKAKEALESRLLGKTVSLRNTRQDQYGRIVASVYHEDTNVGESMIKDGEVGAYGTKMSLWDRVTGNLDPASFRHKEKNGTLEDDPITPKRAALESDKLSSKLEPDALSGGESHKSDKGIVGDLKAFGRAAIESQPALAGGVLMGEAGAAAGSVLGPAGMIGGMLVGAVGGAYLGDKAKDVIKSMIPEETLKEYGFDEQNIAKDNKEHSKSTLAGQIIGGLGFFGPGKVTAAERIFSGAFGVGVEGAEQIQKGEFDPTRLAMAGAGQAVFAKPTKLTSAISDKFGNTERLAAQALARDEAANANAKRDGYIKGQLDKFEQEAKDNPEKIKRMQESYVTPGGEIINPEPVDPRRMSERAKRDGLDIVHNNEGFDADKTTFKDGRVPKTLDELVDVITPHIQGSHEAFVNNIISGQDRELLGKVKIEEVESLPNKDRAHYDPDTNTIRVTKGNKSISTLLHEALHAVTFAKINEGLAEVHSPYRNVATGLEDLVKQIKEAPEYKAYRAKKPAPKNYTERQHIDELVTFGLTNKGMRSFLNKIKIDEHDTALSKLNKLVSELNPRRQPEYVPRPLPPEVRASMEAHVERAKAQGREPSMKVVSALEHDERIAQDRTKTTKPGENRPIGTAKRTLEGAKDDALYREGMARQIYHMVGPEDAKLYLDMNTPHASAIVNDLKDRIGVNIREVDGKQRLANIFKAKILKAMPDLKDRQALPKAIEEGIPLSPEHAKVASDYEKMMKELGEEAYKHGVINGLVENYVTRMAKRSGVPESEVKGIVESIIRTPSVQAGLKGGTKFAKARTMETLEQATLAMEQKGIQIESDIAEIAHGYMTDMYKAIEDKKLVNHLKMAKIDNGYVMINSNSSQIPHGYKIIDHGPYQGWYVHPDIKPALDHVLGAKEPGTFMKAALALNGAIKRSNISASLFHAKSLYEAFIMAKPYLGKEAYKGSLGGVLKVLREGGEGDLADFAIREGGLKLGMSSVEDVSATALQSIGEQADKLINTFSNKKFMAAALGKAEKATLGKIDKFTWDYLHDGLKLLTFSRMLEKAERQHPETPREVHAREIGRFVNNSFGGLDWYDIARQSNSKFEEAIKMAAYSPEGRRYLQTILFAPDWTVSTLRAFTTALPKSLLAPDVIGGVKGMLKPKTQGDFARLYQMKFALTYLTVLNGVNMLTAGHPIWENKDKTRLEFKDGTTMQATKHAMEFIHFAKDTDKFIADKLGFLPKAAIVSVGGLEYAGPDAPKLEDTSLQGRATAIGKTMLPFNVQAYQGAPKGEGLKRTALGTLGMPVYGMTRQQKAEANFEKRRREAIRKINEAQGK